MKTKIKSHGDEVTNFYGKKNPKLDSNCTCLALISLESALRKDENFNPQVFLKECKYTEIKYNDNLSDFSYSGESDEGQIRAIRFMIFEITI